MLYSSLIVPFSWLGVFVHYHQCVQSFHFVPAKCSPSSSTVCLCFLSRWTQTNKIMCVLCVFCGCLCLVDAAFTDWRKGKGGLRMACCRWYLTTDSTWWINADFGQRGDAVVNNVTSQDEGSQFESQPRYECECIPASHQVTTGTGFTCLDPDQDLVIF